VAYNFQTGNYKIKLLTEYEHECGEYTVAKKKVMSYTFIFRKQFDFVFSGLKIIGHGNPDNNLESHCSINTSSSSIIIINQSSNINSTHSLMELRPS
jgi:hypothetical protein